MLFNYPAMRALHFPVDCVSKFIEDKYLLKHTLLL